MASVTFDAATRRFADDLPPAVDSLDLDIADGEFMVLVGPSGCGKSTSLRMVAGWSRWNRGAILIDGVDVVGMAPPRARDVAMVFQNYALYPNMTVADNMGFALRNAGMSKPDTGKRVAEVAEMLDIAHLLDRKPPNCRGDNGSGWRWDVRSSGVPRSSAWTSRCPTSTRSCESAPARRSPRCSGMSQCCT